MSTIKLLQCFNLSNPISKLEKDCSGLVRALVKCFGWRYIKHTIMQATKELIFRLTRGNCSMDRRRRQWNGSIHDGVGTIGHGLTMDIAKGLSFVNIRVMLVLPTLT